MIRTFAYLLVRSTRNRLARQLSRLRRPRYLAALLLGLAYLWVMLLQQRPVGSGAQPRPGWIELAGAMALALAVGWAWLFAAERRVLAFSPAEVTFLFSAPVTRRQLVHFKLLRNQLVVLLNTLLWTLLLAREPSGIPAPLRALSIWVVLTTLSLHRLGASFVRTSLAEHGEAGARHRVVSLTLLAVALSAAAWAVVDAWPALASAFDEGIGPFLSTLAAAAERPVPRALLWPFRQLVAPLAAGSDAAWVRAMGPALGILAVHYVWVVRSDTAFEEAALEESLRRARRAAGRSERARAAVTNPRVAPIYRLSAAGSPAGAIVWKNLTSVARNSRLRLIATGLLLAGVTLAVLSFRGEGQLAELVGWFAAMWAGFLVVIGPQWVRSDLRGDLPKLDLLRSYPLRGGSIVAAEVTSSTAVLTALQLGVAALAYLAFLGNRNMEPGLTERTAVLVTAAVLLPGINLLGLLIQNGAAVLFPSWVHLGAGRQGGVEALGQNMLALMAHLLVLALALLAPAAAGGSILLSLYPALGWWALPIAALGAIGVMALEALVAIRRLGRAFERTEPAELAA